jgi:hypothetical protein
MRYGAREGETQAGRAAAVFTGTEIFPQRAELTTERGSVAFSGLEKKILSYLSKSGNGANLYV